MLKTLKIVATVLIIIILIIYLLVKLFWPKEYVVNAPVLQFITGIGGGVLPEKELATKIHLPDGYHISIYADNLGQARALLYLVNGDILLSTPRSGEIKVLLADRNNDGKADGVTTILKDLNSPHGLAFRDGYLYIGETDAIIRVPYDINTHTADTSNLLRIVTGLPGGGNHWSRTVHFGPDNKLYLTVGSSCNVCLEKDQRRAAMMRYNIDGTDGEVYASGLRNTVGFTWQPRTGKLYGVDNGRDLLGDDFPPGELNLIEKNQFYGWPYLHGNNVPDPEFGNINDPRKAKAKIPAHNFMAHTAPLSIIFLTSDQTPKAYKNAALVTLHGSWNRSKKSGYEVVSLHWNSDGSISEKPFATGFMKNEKVYGRPVDIIQAPDGTIYLSDDFAKAVYQITYGKQQTTSAMPTEKTIKTQNGNPEMIKQGAKLYQQHGCARCHEATGAAAKAGGYKPLKDLSSRYDIKQIQQLLKLPPSPMPAVTLSDLESQALAEYLLSR